MRFFFFNGRVPTNLSTPVSFTISFLQTPTQRRWNAGRGSRLLLWWVIGSWANDLFVSIWAKIRADGIKKKKKHPLSPELYAVSCVMKFKPGCLWKNKQARTHNWMCRTSSWPLTPSCFPMARKVEVRNYSCDLSFQTLTLPKYTHHHKHISM